MDKQYKTVVQGEASESTDEEEEVSNETETPQEGPKAFVVEGEASESEEEELDSSGQPIRKELPPRRFSAQSNSLDSIDEITGVPTLSSKQIGRPKYDTVLNRKLWESNLSLCNNLNGMVSQAYLSAAKEISNCGQQLSKSHAAIQDVSHHMRLMTNDSFNLHDTIDIIATCKLLPTIILPDRFKLEATAAATSITTVTEASEVSTQVV